MIGICVVLSANISFTNCQNYNTCFQENMIAIVYSVDEEERKLVLASRMFV